MRGPARSTTHWSATEHSLLRESFNGIVSRHRVDPTDTLIRDGNMGRQAELGSDWCPPGLFHRRKAGRNSIHNTKSGSSVQARVPPADAAVAAANTRWFNGENRDELLAQATGHFSPYDELPLSARAGPRAHSAPLWESPWTPRDPPRSAEFRSGFGRDDPYFRPESAPPGFFPQNFGGKMTTSHWPSSEATLNRESFNCMVSHVPCNSAWTMRKEAQLGKRPSSSLGAPRQLVPGSFASMQPAGVGGSSRGATRGGTVPVSAWT
mmetsp:Transcript_108951/g.216369  ORF Transcript_108951/g.216369 Transcript_108951/m.216369 type:complete len:265 (+) Transcript_108951:113-907(+)